MDRQLIRLMCVAGVVFFSAASFAGQDEPVSITAILTYRDHGGEVRAASQILEDQTFDVEPDLGDRQVIRGILGQEIRFIWDYTESKLYIDNNGNGDLTDDPEGVYSDEGDAFPFADYYRQSFSDIRLSLEREDVALTYTVSATMTRFSTHFEFCEFTVHSSYSGTLDLNGKQWVFSIADNADGVLNLQDKLLIAPALEEGDSNVAADLSLPGKLFLDGSLYQCGYTFVTEGRQTAVQLTLTAKPTAVGRLSLPGEHLNTVQLTCQDNETAIVLYQPRQTATLPVGTFYVQRVLLVSPDGGMASMQRLRRHDERAISIHEDQAAELLLGAPLNHSIDIQRQGAVLRFGYKLEGVGGERYTVQEVSSGQAENPTIEIYKGDTLLASGAFEYG